MRPELSVIIPVFRGDVSIRYTLESVRRAADGLQVETMVVDDGSEPPITGTLSRLGYTPEQVLWQKNQGLLAARLHGLRHAEGAHVLFLDPDCLVSRDKFRRHLEAMERTSAEVSYSDTARTTLEGDFDLFKVVADKPLPEVTDAAEFFINVRPPRHAAIYRTDWLREVVSRPIFPAARHFDTTAESWLYHVASVVPGRTVRVPGPHAITGRKPDAPAGESWEMAGCAALAAMEAFAKHCPRVLGTAHPRRLVGEAAFRAWRDLPRGFSPEFGERLLRVWRCLGGSRRSELGDGRFRSTAAIVGPELAGRLHRRFRNANYDTCRTLTDDEFKSALKAIPSVRLAVR